MRREGVHTKIQYADADVQSADVKIRISREVLNSLTRNLKLIFTYTYFIYSVHYFVVWKHTFLILERRLSTIFVWLSPLLIRIKTVDLHTNFSV